MGLNDIGLTKAQNYDKWMNAVATNPDSADKEFRVIGDTKTIEAYNKDLENLSNGYIQMYDINGDNKVGLDEFIQREKKSSGIDENSLSAEQKTIWQKCVDGLKAVFDKLNVNNNGDSKDVLDSKEIMNMFFSMDAFNDDLMASGSISQDEAMETTAVLYDTSETGDKFKQLLTNNYNTNFKNYTTEHNEKK